MPVSSRLRQSRSDRRWFHAELGLRKRNLRSPEKVIDGGTTAAGSRKMAVKQAVTNQILRKRLADAGAEEPVSTHRLLSLIG